MDKYFTLNQSSNIVKFYEQQVKDKLNKELPMVQEEEKTLDIE